MNPQRGKSGEWARIEPMILECIPVPGLARIIWEYARELRVSREDHHICVMMRSSDRSRIESDEAYFKIDHGLAAFVRFRDNGINGWISYAYHANDGGGSGGLWGGRLRIKDHPRWDLHGVELDPDIKLIENPDYSATSDLAIKRGTTIFSREYRNSIFAACGQAVVVEYKDAMNTILDMLHVDWMTELTRHW
jgi:hypothetical protein